MLVVDCRVRASTEAGRLSAMVARDRGRASGEARSEGYGTRFKARGDTDTGHKEREKKQNRRAPLSRLRPIEGGICRGLRFSAVSQVGGMSRGEGHL